MTEKVEAEVVQYKPGDMVDDKIKVCKNGAGWDTTTNRFTHPPGTFCDDVPNGTITTSDQGRALVRRKYEKAQEKTRKRVLERFKETGNLPDNASYSDVVAIIGTEAHVSALENMIERPRDAVHAGAFGLKLAGMGELVARQEGIKAQSVTINQVVVQGNVVEDDWQ